MATYAETVCMSEWISVKDKIPAILKDVLVYRLSYENNEGLVIFKMHPVDRYKVAFLDSKGSWHLHEDLEIKINSNITHWMPLPDAPL